MKQIRTTLDYPAMEIGEIAAEPLIKKLKNPYMDFLTSIISNHCLVVRSLSPGSILNGYLV